MTEGDQLDLGDLMPRPFGPSGSSFAGLLSDPVVPAGGSGGLGDRVVDGTTVLALRFADGVVVAGDRRATAGNMISRTDMRKVFPADRHSAVAIAGAAGPAMEMARLFATELEHYEKVEGEVLSLEGKSNRLAGMVRAHLPMAMRGMVVVPLLAGVDPHSGEPGIHEYDPIGGRYLARRFAVSGSGGVVAAQTLRHRFDPRADEAAAATVAVEALFDAAEQDSATGGPDLVRRIYPIVAVIDGDGYRELEPEAVAAIVDEVVAAHRERVDRDQA
ncbi:proteasome subunit beta [Salsipaludibacter albus]|uniref:proteasome subunit beta n=1 Tax=Salsipaludibacter albus TaxID=2849650 RepID=UPI001EE46D03|nr:proteasome subunit beta [Salsipaludibacter albus]